MSLDMYVGAEELELGADAVEEITEAVEEAVRTEIAEVAVELEEQTQAVEELVEEVAVLDESVEELEETIEGLESLLGSGNFNSVAFSSIYNRGQKLAARLGSHDVARLGAESVTDVATAQLAAREGVESFMDTVKGYAKKAAEYIKHIFNTVISFFVSLFNQADRLQKRHDAIKGRVEKADKVKEKIKLGGWNAYFDYAKNGLKGTDPSEFYSVLDKLGELAELGKKVDGVTLAAFNTAYSAVAAAIKAAASKVGKANAKKAGKDTVTIGQEAALRFRGAYQEGSAKDFSEAAAMARSIKINVGKDAAVAKKLTSGETKSKLDKAGLTSALSGVKTNIDAMRANKVQKAFSAAERDRVVATLNNAKASDDTKAKEVEGQVALVRAIYSSSASSTTTLHKLCASMIGAELDGISAHI